MDYTTWPEFQQNQTLIQNSALPSYPPPSSSAVLSSYPPPQSSYTAQYIPYPQNPNHNPTSTSSHVATVVEPGLNPPGVESYVPPLPMATQVVGHEQPHLVPNYSYGEIQTQVVDPSSLVDSSGYYFDPNAQNWAAREAVRLYGADPVTYGADVNSMPSNGTEQLAVANPNPTWWTNTVTQPQATQPPPGNGTWKKYPKKAKTKIIQPAYCEVCKIDCTSKEVLDQHKLGKKHKKNVEKLRELLRPPQVHQPVLVSSNPVIGPQLPNNKSKSTSGSKSNKRKTAETPEELEKKKKKVLEGGAAAEAVRICAVCNVICNSETVYNYHLAGQKHAALMKKASAKNAQSIAG